ncbi:uncharacterized protein LOC123267368 [Cotesia glomerata]|uniref:uncharacterized protein LOC123267368 n=1 Tax=Cotesia glomerata TaxID=32391 RepID=UPI001D02D02C|nr:uncharacterized protein LOC123267368 [Cotesia glomerata]
MKPKNLLIFEVVVIALVILSFTNKVDALGKNCQRWLQAWFPIYCTSNKDCPDNLSCFVEAKECRNPCNSTSCKFTDDICLITNHTINCTSNAKSCTKQKDCPDNLDCLEKKCRDPCDGKKCGKGKICVVQDHKDICGSINGKNNKTELDGKEHVVRECQWWDFLCRAGWY